MPKVQKLSETQYLQLLKLASGLLKTTRGDLEEALRLAIPLHLELLEAVRTEGIRADLGPVEAVLHVPEEGGLAVRIDQHPAVAMLFPVIDPAEFDTIEHTSPPSFLPDPDDWARRG